MALVLTRFIHAKCVQAGVSCECTTNMCECASSKGHTSTVTQQACTYIDQGTLGPTKAQELFQEEKAGVDAGTLEQNCEGIRQPNERSGCGAPFSCVVALSKGCE